MLASQFSVEMFVRARERGRRGQLWSLLTRRSNRLFSLKTIEANCEVKSCYDAGTKTVSIDQICGSEGREHEFDREFNPLQSYTKDRWLGIATVRKRGRELPPVVLIHVGDRYFVRDGHHRISVSRTMGELAIEAKVVVWQVDRPLPWDAPAPTTLHGAAR